MEGIHRWPMDSPHKGPGMQSFDVLFVVKLNQLLSKQSIWWGLFLAIWLHCDGLMYFVLLWLCHEFLVDLCDLVNHSFQNCFSDTWMIFCIFLWINDQYRLVMILVRSFVKINNFCTHFTEWQDNRDCFFHRLVPLFWHLASFGINHKSLILR